MTHDPTFKPGPKERRFLDALRDLFVGAEVKGKSGYINLMRIKSKWFREVVEPALFEEIAKSIRTFPEFREELFDKLNAFFSRYFSRSGSICFAYTPQHMSVYERVYTDEQDVVLFWKTHMLHYVKTDRLFNDLSVEIDGHSFFFDCAAMAHKKSNEKRELVYTLEKIETKKDVQTIRLTVDYSERGRKTKDDEILKAIHKAGIKVSEATLDKAMRLFGRQSEVDYFINKDAGGFLREQFDLWMYQYVFKDETHWTEPRIRQLQVLKDIAGKLITFIAQFEDELLRIWTKPKFVRNSHYVITLDRIAAREDGMEVLATFLKHDGIKAQTAEWLELGIVGKDFNPKSITEGKGKDLALSPEWRSLPLDTRHFDKSLEISLLVLFDDLDNQLDGRLIKSENWQALNTFKEKFNGRVKCCYIDPPYNTGDDEFIYEDSIRHSSWLAMMNARLNLANQWLCSSGSLFVQLNDFEDGVAKCLLSQTFGSDGFVNRISVKTKSPSGFKTVNKGVFSSAEYIFLYSKFPHSPSYNSLYVASEYDQNYKFEITNPDDKYENWVIRSISDPVLASFDCSAPREVAKKFGDNAYGSALAAYALANNRQVFRLAEIDEIGAGKETVDLKHRSLKEPNKIHCLLRKGYEPRYVLGGQELVFYSRKVREVNGELTPTLPASNIWTDIAWEGIAKEGGVTLKRGKKPERLLHRVIEMASTSKDMVLDFFGGSGTSAAVSHKLGRKWLVTEFQDESYGLAERRLKLVLSGEQSGVSKITNFGGGGFIKLFDLEQYEDAISRASYAEEDDLFRNTKTDVFSQYVFFRDLKLVEGLELDRKSKKVSVHLDRLYPDIDLAETLSCITGKWIRRVTADEVEFADGSRESLTDPDWRLIKPFIFWGPVV